MKRWLCLSVLAAVSGCGSAPQGDGPTPQEALETLEVTIDGRAVVEGDTGSAIVELPVVLSGEAPADAQIRIKAVDGGSAELGQDYLLPESLTILIPKGHQVGALAVEILGDRLEEIGGETVSFEIVGTNGPSIGEESVGELIIQDDDHPLPVIEVTESVTVTEGDDAAQTLTIPVSISAALNEDLLFEVALEGSSATADEDFGLLAETEFLIAAGETSAALNVSISPDRIDEPTERFAVRYLDSEEAVFSHRRTIVEILDNDPEPVVEFDRALRPVAETVGVVEMDIVLDRPSSSIIRVPVRVDGTASPGGDYEIIEGLGEGGTIDFLAGSVSQTLVFSIIDDTIPEGGETITVSLGPPLFASVGDIDEQTLLISGNIALNDTGVTTFSDGVDVTLSAPPAEYPGQDAEFGRDVSEGGFDFVLLDVNGNVWRSGDRSAPWCAFDQTTGLTWQLKGPATAIQDYTAQDPEPPLEEQDKIDNARQAFSSNFVYSFYSEDSSTNGGSQGFINQDLPNGNPQSFDCGYVPEEGNARNYILRCNTESYLTELNRYGICGFIDWRLPTIEELRGIVDYGVKADGTPRPALHPAVFPHNSESTFFTSTPSAQGTREPDGSPTGSSANLCIDMSTDSKEVRRCLKNSLHYVRAVRSEDN